MNFKQVEVRKILRGVLAENTLVSYEYGWKQYLKFLDTKEVSGSNLSNWRQHLIESGLSASTINARLKGVKAVIRALYELREIPRELHWDIQEIRELPKHALKDRRRPNNRVRISPEQMRELCSLPNAVLGNELALRDRAMLLTLATTGVRVSELLAMRYNDLRKLPNGKYTVENIMGKWSDDPRPVPLSPEAYEAIMDWIEFRPVKSPYIFTAIKITYDNVGHDVTYSDKPMTVRMAYWRVKLYGKQMGMPEIKTHDIRRFVGTQLAKKDIRTAQKVLGHKSPSTTSNGYILDDVETGVTDSLF